MFRYRPSFATSSAPKTKEGRFQTLKSLQKYPVFRYLWGNSFAAYSVVWMQNLVMGWLVYELTGSAFLLSLFTAVRMLPMLLGPIGGVIADRVDRVKLLLFCQVFSVLLSASLAALAASGRLQHWHLVFIGFLMGLTYSPTQPARSVLLMGIVGMKDLSNAIALDSIAFYATMVAGPALGGVLLGSLGPAPALWLAVLLNMVAAFALLPLLNRVPHVPAHNGSALRDLREGFRIVLSNHAMAAVLFVTLSANMFIWPVIQAFMPVFAKDVLRAGPEGLGFLMTAHGAGALLGTLAIASLGNLTWKGKLYILGTGAFGLLFTSFALSHSFPLSMAILGLAGVASSGFGVMQPTLMLILAPQEVRGRAMGVLMFSIGILPLATLAQGAIANAIGVPLTTATAGGLLALSMAFVFIWAPSLRNLQ